jgi:hypothetical protein
MTKLSDTQSIILSAAAQRDDGNVLPLPGSLRGGAAGKVVGALLSRGLIVERVTDSMAKADPVLNRIWRNEPDGRGVLLFITPAGLDEIGIEPAGDPEAAAADEPAAGEPAADDVPRSSLRRRSGAGQRRRRPRASTSRQRQRPATAPSRRWSSPYSGAPRARPSPRSPRPPIGGHTRYAASSQGR